MQKRKQPKQIQQKPDSSQPPTKPQAITCNYSGFIILRLAPDLPPTQAENLMAVAKELKLEDLYRTLEQYKLVRSGRLIRSLSTQKILELEAQAARPVAPQSVQKRSLTSAEGNASAAKPRRSPRRSLTSYWRIDARAQRRNPGEIVAQLNRLKGVAHAYQELAAGPPAGPADPDVPKQGYLNPAPVGIDAFYAWAAGTFGAGVKIADVETGWYENHEDLPANGRSKMLCGANRIMQSDQNHGTAVLGILAAQHDNNKGIAGIAPKVDQIGLASHYLNGPPDSTGHVADALLAAVEQTDQGDIILLEVQRNVPSYGLPTEIEQADWDAIRLAVDLNRTVIEPAGNGNCNLDTLDNTVITQWAPGERRLKRGHKSFADSGAIMVGASAGPPDHDRHPDCNYGSRVDCFAWGNGAWTCKWQNSYDYFTHTSAASAIVAGAAVIVQSWRVASNKPPFPPNEIRTRLKKGTSSQHRIGKMPDLTRALQ